MIALAAAAFVAIFFFDVPVPARSSSRAGAHRLSSAARAGLPAVPGRRRPRRPAASTSPTPTALLGEELPDACAPERRAASLRVARGAGWRSGWCRSRRCCSALGRRQRLQPDRALLQQDGRGDLRRRLCRAGLCRAAGGRDTISWLQPGEMLDGLGMAETTPGPLIMVAAVRRLHGRLSAIPARCRRCWPATLGGLLTTWVTFVALLPLDLPRRALHRDAARQQGAGGRAVGDHRRRGRRDPEPRDLVRPAHAVPADHCRFARSGCRSTCRCCQVSILPPSCWRSPRRPRSSASISGCCGCWRARARPGWRCGLRGLFS